MLRSAPVQQTGDVFELFSRRRLRAALWRGRRSGQGVPRAAAFRFDEESLRFLLDSKVVDQAMADWLAGFCSPGDIWGYPEGEIYFPGSPLVIVESTFGEAVVLEPCCSAFTTTTPPLHPPPPG